jgi:hypothetical protein
MKTALDLRVEGTVMWAGREAVRLRGVPGEEWDWGWDPDPLSWGADEYEAVVDAERGVLLRCASRLGGEDFDTLEVEEIHFDEQFPEDTFASSSAHLGVWRIPSTISRGIPTDKQKYSTASPRRSSASRVSMRLASSRVASRRSSSSGL